MEHFRYFIILVVSTYYILCISWIIKCLKVFQLKRDKRSKKNSHS